LLHDDFVGRLDVRGLSRDEIADLLVTIRARSAEDRRLKRRAQQYVAARDRARREDAARVPEVADVRGTYGTAKALAELFRDALIPALPAVANRHELAHEIESLIADWRDEPALVARSAEDAIEELKAARRSVVICSPL
jgi:hypothetical protein